MTTRCTTLTAAQQKALKIIVDDADVREAVQTAVRDYVNNELKDRLRSAAKQGQPLDSARVEASMTELEGLFDRILIPAASQNIRRNSEQ